MLGHFRPVCITIAGREISNKFPPYIVAEISCNHNGNLELAKQLIHVAKKAGADAAKLQCYGPDDLTIDCDKPDFIMKDGPWKGWKLYELYAKAGTPREWFPTLFSLGKEIGITVFSSVFSKEGVDFLEELDCPAYKIASMEVVDTNLIEYTINTGKPVIISTGMTTPKEMEDSKWGWKRNVAMLHCVSGYPTPIEEANLGYEGLKGLWMACPIVGISDHTLGWTIPVAATALGAVMIEKHLALFDIDGVITLTEDSDFSMRPNEFAEMCQKVRAIWRAMQPSERKSEESSRQARRSLYAVKDIKSGEAFTAENVRSIRPAYGMPPSKLSEVLKSFAACDIERGTALDEGMLLPF